MPYIWYGFALALILGSSAQAVPAQVLPAVDGIMEAFQNHPLVAISDDHGLAQEQDFYATLVRDPRFARDVGNVVVEFGDAADQPIMDRYLAGENIAYTELRKVWTDTIGWTPPPFSLGYANFFAQVRAINLSLPAEQRIHVWLGDPPIDWAKTRTRADFVPAPGLRDRFPAELIEREILTKHRKSLVIFGTFHFNTDPVLQALVGSQPTLAQLLQQNEPGSLFVVTPYTGYVEKSCDEAFEKGKAAWPVPSLATPVRGTSLDDPASRQTCATNPHGPFPPSVPDAQKAAIAEGYERLMTGVAGDALLYLGPSFSLSTSPRLPDFYLDPDYRAEVMRHMAILGPPNMDTTMPFVSPKTNSAAPQPRRP